MSARTPASHALYGSDPRLLGPLAARLLERGTLKWIITLAASLGAILEVIDTSITNVALPDIRGNLGATLSEAGWVSTAYACANVVIIPLSAWLGDRFGRKNYFVFSLVGFTLSSVLCGLSPSLGFLIAARVLQGLAGGGLLAKAQAVVFESFAARRNAARRRPSLVWASSRARRWARSWAAGSPTTWAGAGFSSSTSPLASSPC